MTQLTLIGFGEAAQAFAKGWNAPRGFDLGCYDRKMGGAERATVLERAAALSVTAQDSPEAALSGAQIVLSLVTADQAVHAARDYAPFLRPEALWLDCNSCAPSSKTQAAGYVQAAGGRYVDVAVMAPVYPKLHHVPLLVSGPHAASALPYLQALDMRATLAGPEIGAASSVKMIRSVMIKGMEALSAECLLAARRANLTDAVIASLQASDPDTDWAARGNYNLERMMVHGTRRAAEMEEVAKTLADLGLPNDMAQAVTRWQRAVGSLGLGAGKDGLESRSTAVLEGLAHKG
ncbi:DUF1932 domain-containing protein [Thioclava sp. GXIMD4216]|uniref:NAD(P)-dependent oxidoreductase n=1 Tax=Thioclava sp. GXIMD4216 TaxID=3131929 RepID=UPI0030CBB0E3